MMGSRYRPSVSRYTSAISPSETYALTASTRTGMRFCPSGTRRPRAELAGDLGLAPARLDRPHPLDLLALQRLVEPEVRDRLLLGLDVAIHADHDALSRILLELRAVPESAISCCGKPVSSARTMPPSSSIRWMSRHASASIRSVSASTK